MKCLLYLQCYAEACNEWRGHLRGSAAEQHCSEETSQWLRPVGDSASDLTGPGIEPQTVLQNRCEATDPLTARKFEAYLDIF